MCIRLPRRTWPTISCIPIFLYMFGLVRFQKLETVSFDRIATFICLAISAAGAHHQFLISNALLTPTLWVWLTLRCMFFLTFPFNIAAWIFSLIVAKVLQIGHVGGLASAMWLAKLGANIVFGDDVVARPGFMGITIIFLAGLWLQANNTRGDKSVILRCIFTNLHAFVAWRVTCYSTFPFYARTDIELLGMAMVFIVVWFMGALRFEEEKYTIEGLPAGHPFPHSIWAAKSDPVCAPLLRQFDMETGGMTIRQFYKSRNYDSHVSSLQKVRAKYETAQTVEQPPPQNPIYSHPEPYPNHVAEQYDPLPPPDTPVVKTLRKRRKKKKKNKGPLANVGRPSPQIRQEFAQPAEQQQYVQPTQIKQEYPAPVEPAQTQQEYPTPAEQYTQPAQVKEEYPPAPEEQVKEECPPAPVVKEESLTDMDVVEEAEPAAAAESAQLPPPEECAA